MARFATLAEVDEFRRRCERCGISHLPEPVSIVGEADRIWRESGMRHAILTEILTGHVYTFDPLAAAQGDVTQPVPDWLLRSRLADAHTGVRDP